MSTLLNEILAESGLPTAPISPSPVHQNTCSCKFCRKARSSRAASHPHWKVRRNKRLCRPAPQSNQSASQYDRYRDPQEQFLGSVLGAASALGSGIGKIASIGSGIGKVVGAAGKAGSLLGKAGNIAGKAGGLFGKAGGLAGRARGVAGKLSAISRKVPKSKIISIGKRQRRILKQQWEDQRDNTKSDVAKARYQKYIDVINKRQRPSWHQSERDLQTFFQRLGMPGQRTYLGGQPARWVQRADGRFVPPKGSVVPDINPADAMVEVKNYNINNEPALVRALKKQIENRKVQGPVDPSTGQVIDQKVILDMRGQKASKDQLLGLLQRLSQATGLPEDNLQAVTWEHEGEFEGEYEWEWEF